MVPITTITYTSAQLHETYKLIVILRGDSNLGPKRLSLLEFDTWQLRPLGHHGLLKEILVLTTNVERLVANVSVFGAHFDI